MYSEQFIKSLHKRKKDKIHCLFYSPASLLVKLNFYRILSSNKNCLRELSSRKSLRPVDTTQRFEFKQWRENFSCQAELVRHNVASRQIKGRNCSIFCPISNILISNIEIPSDCLTCRVIFCWTPLMKLREITEKLHFYSPLFWVNLRVSGVNESMCVLRNSKKATICKSR